MKFIDYLNEFKGYNPNENRSKSMSINEAMPFIKANCKRIYKYYEWEANPRIYRGNYNIINSAALVDPTQFERHSRNTSNYYTLLMSNLPSWKNYPPRSKSIVCTNYKGRAEAYGGENVYLVLPFDSCKIGLVPDVDIFVVTIPKLYRMRFETFNAELGLLLRKVNHTSIGYDEDWATLKHHSEKVTDLKDYVSSNAIAGNAIAEAFEDSKKKNLLEFLDDIMDPNVLGFKVLRPGNQLPPAEGMMNSNELWVGYGPSVLVSIYHLEEIGLPVIEGVEQLGEDE